MRVLELSKGFVAIIDKEDFRRVNKYKWHVHFAGGTKKKHAEPYARATVCGKKVYLHRFITGAYVPWHVDHLNRQTLDNRRCNLEVVEPQENQRRKRPRK